MSDLKLSPSEFIRRKQGSVEYAEFSINSEAHSCQKRFSSQFSNLKRQGKGEVMINKINGFYSDGDPVYIIKFTLIERDETDEDLGL